jgi:16S rRNA G966 N2-methylase RsmD
VIVLDPPYGERGDQLAAVLAQAADLVAPGGLIVVEHARKHPAPPAAGRLPRTREVASGDSALAFYACPP